LLKRGLLSGERNGKSVNNFAFSIPTGDSDLFDFIGTDIPRSEIEIERELVVNEADGHSPSVGRLIKLTSAPLSGGHLKIISLL
jgi:hypothetical protein